MLLSTGIAVAVLQMLCIHFPNCKVAGDARTMGQQQEEASVVTHNYQGTVFIYPAGIRSERDIPVCSKWVTKTSQVNGMEFLTLDDMQRDMPFGIAGEMGFSNKSLTQNDKTVARHEEDESVRWESACNVIHKRYFYPPVVERLCRCPERTECPWQWSQPPSYPSALSAKQKGEGGQKNRTIHAPKGSRDPYTVMLSSRSQAKFCVEVSSVLPKCHATLKDKKRGEVREANLIKTVKKVGGVDDVPSVKVNCYCPSLYRQWTYEGVNISNGGISETNYYYACKRVPNCRKDDVCANIRTDLHFSFYHCACPQDHLCLPHVYPPESVYDVKEDVNEVLFRGQVAPAYCKPYLP